jgi:hypothetical protein
MRCHAAVIFLGYAPGKVKRLAEFSGKTINPSRCAGPGKA